MEFRSVPVSSQLQHTEILSIMLFFICSCKGPELSTDLGCLKIETEIQKDSKKAGKYPCLPGTLIMLLLSYSKIQIYLKKSLQLCPIRQTPTEIWSQCLRFNKEPQKSYGALQWEGWFDRELCEEGYDGIDFQMSSAHSAFLLLHEAMVAL